MQIFTSLNDPKLAQLLRGGAVGVLPTDTVYGLVCAASDKAAVKRLYDLKGQDMPGVLIAAGVDNLVELGLKRRYLKAIEDYWPSALSVIIPSGPELAYLDMGKMSLAMRVPADDTVRGLLQAAGALLTTSANQLNMPIATNINEAQQYFGDFVDFYVDGGTVADRQPSTLIRIVDDAIEVLREGAVKIDENGRITTE